MAQCSSGLLEKFALCMPREPECHDGTTANSPAPRLSLDAATQGALQSPFSLSPPTSPRRSGCEAKEIFQPSSSGDAIPGDELMTRREEHASLLLREQLALVKTVKNDEWLGLIARLRGNGFRSSCSLLPPGGRGMSLFGRLSSACAGIVLDRTVCPDLASTPIAAPLPSTSPPLLLRLMWHQPRCMPGHGPQRRADLALGILRKDGAQPASRRHAPRGACRRAGQPAGCRSLEACARH